MKEDRATTARPAEVCRAGAGRPPGVESSPGIQRFPSVTGKGLFLSGGVFRDPVPPSICSLLHDWLHCRWTTPFGRYFQMCLQSTLAWVCQRSRNEMAAQGSRERISAASSAVFPMPLPFPEVEEEQESETLRAFEARRRRKRRCSRHLTNLMAAACNFFDAGCPKGAQPARYPDRELTEVQVSAVRRMQRDAECMCASSGGEIASKGRGTSRLNSMILGLENRYSSSGRQIRANETVTVAQPVDGTRISLPQKAGQLRGAKLMCPERAKVFRDLHSIVLDEDRVGPRAIRSCHMLNRNDEVQFVRKLLEREMIVLIEESEIERHPHDNSLLRGGFFAVPHKGEKLRLIYDRRCLNALEADLSPVWLKLPHGSQFTECILDSACGLRGSADDLASWFYQIKHEETWWRRQAVGRRLHGADFASFGATPGRHYRACLVVVAMGDRNGVAFAQECHEYMLRAGDLLGVEQTLRFGESFPKTQLVEGAYVDDHVFALQVPLARMKCTPGHDDSCEHCRDDGGRLEDVIAVEQLEETYAKHGAEQSREKSTRYLSEFVAWGTTVNGLSGQVSVALDKRRQLARLAYAVCKRGFASKPILLSLVGSLVHPIMHCRTMMSIFSEVYIFIATMPSCTECRLPPGVVDELLIGSIMLASCYTNIRAPVSSTLSATDATNERGGACRCTVPHKLAHAAYRRGEQRGEHGLLRWDDIELEELPTKMERPSAEVDSLVKCLNWRSPIGYNFTGRREHINIMELRALLDEITRRAESGERNTRIVVFIDSRVVTGCVTKGRSSSKPLNRWLRRLMIICLASEIRVKVVWTSTTANPADAPSRRANLPVPSKTPEWVDRLYQDARTHACILHSTLPTAVVVPSRVPGLPHEVATCKELRNELRCKPCVAHQPFECCDVDKRFSPDGHSTSTSCGSDNSTGSYYSSREKPDIREGAKTSSSSLSKGEFREYYSGTGRLAKAVRRRGRRARELEAFSCGAFDSSCDIGDPAVVSREIDDARAGRIAGAHFGIVCSSWCRMTQRFNHGTRSEALPYGDGSSQKENTGNEQLQQMWRMILVFLELHIPFTIENPVDSLLWHSIEMLRLKQVPGIHNVVLDQCMYFLRAPDWRPTSGDFRIRKRTRLLGNVAELSSLKRICDKRHHHSWAWGHVRIREKRISRAAAAGAYPQNLCFHLAKLFCRCMQ